MSADKDFSKDFQRTLEDVPMGQMADGTIRVITVKEARMEMKRQHEIESMSADDLVKSIKEEEQQKINSLDEIAAAAEEDMDDDDISNINDYDDLLKETPET